MNAMIHQKLCSIDFIRAKEMMNKKQGIQKALDTETLDRVGYIYFGSNIRYNPNE